jgi:DNA-binding transcriptional ArsR family regulator
MTYQTGRQLDALGDATRRAIFERIAQGSIAVGDIALDLPVSRPAVSQHLKVLKDAGLVTDRAEGTRRLYSIDREGLASLRGYFDRFWDDALDAFRRAAEAAAPPPRPPAKKLRAPKRRLARTKTTTARVRRKERRS